MGGDERGEGECHQVEVRRVWGTGCFSMFFILNNVPLTLLSATIPPAHVQTLMNSLYISLLKVIRCPSWWPELFMAVDLLPPDNVIAACLTLLCHYQESYSGQKILVFWRTKSKVNMLVSLVPLSTGYHIPILQANLLP